MNIVTINTYDQYRKRLFNGGAVDLTTIPLKLALVTSAYVPDQNLDEYWSEVVANEVAGAQYTAGGNVCDFPTVVMDAAGLITIDAGDPNVWPQDVDAGFDNAERAVLYADTGDAATSPLIGYGDVFAATRGNKTGAFACAFAATGIFNIPRGI